ncbi:DNA polymerase zeta catalytic subunit [Glycine soja]|nr:DNA polymerase zeta catalytic subunit [Glycine soja]
MSDSQSNSEIFSIRIVTIDYYMAPPIPDADICYSSFHGGKVNEVPVIRVYGPTPAGQKTCLHIHRVNRTSELARVFGIEFFSVLSRGSQYRVESMFLRLAHTQNYLAISPGKQQVASQPAMECLPLVMEPESGFYSDPVVVLDFQSLYPSMIIAYNLCFCTCLGKVVASKANTLGVSSFSPEQHVLQDLKDQILLTPNGVMFVPSKVRRGILPRLLEEILTTRIMVKQAIKKLAPPEKVLQRVKTYLHRQWKRILSGRICLKDFIFAKEVRLGTYSARISSLPPAAIVATKAMTVDPRAEPRYAERIPYVVIHGEPGARLVDMVVDPLEVLAIDSPFRINDLYYINKQIVPALQRVFGLVGADLNHWFSEMPRPTREASAKHTLTTNFHQTRIDYYYLSKHCVLCDRLVQASARLCNQCSENEVAAATAVISKTSKLEQEMQHLVAVCHHCGGGDRLLENGVKCTSISCLVFYERRKVQKELLAATHVAADKDLYPRCTVEWF